MKNSMFQWGANTLFACAFLFLISACTGEDGDVGPSGPAGPAGPTGPTGQSGAAGADGTNGTNGSNGTNGADGQDGNSYEDYYNDFQDGSVEGMELYGDAGWFLAERDLTPGVSDRDINRVIGTQDITNSQIVGLRMNLDSDIDQIVEFDVWISSELNFDFFNWYIDGTRVNGISGFGGPFHFIFIVPAGSGEITFEYDKDNIDLDPIGDDNALIDNVQITNYSKAGRVDLSDPELPETVALATGDHPKSRN